MSDMGAMILGAYVASVAVWWAVHAIDVRFQEKEAAQHWALADSMSRMTPRTHATDTFVALEKRHWEDRINLAQRDRVLRRWSPVWPVLVLGMLVEMVRRRTACAGQP